MATLNSYLNAVNQKVNDPAIKRLLQFGQTFTTNVAPLRDSLGMAQTMETIEQTARNAYNFCQGKVALSNMFNFSEGGASHEDVSNVRTIGAIDLTILALSQSLIPFVCVDRGMATPETTIYFNELKSTSADGVGGVKKDEMVAGNFTPPNTNVFLGSTKEGEGDGKIDLGKDILPKTVTVTAVVGNITYVGKDFTGDGNIYFGPGADGSAYAGTASVDYSTGIVDLNTTPAGAKVTAEGSIDPTRDESGDQVLTVEPVWTPIQLISEPMNIVLKNNLANMLYMQKTYTLATGTTTSPYNDVLFQRVKNTYIESINSMIIRKMVKATVGSQVLTADLSGYDTQHYAATKNDIIAQLILSMKAKLLGTTGVGLSALIVNSNAAAILESIPVQFVANPQIGMGINGLVGLTHISYI